MGVRAVAVAIIAVALAGLGAALLWSGPLAGVSDAVRVGAPPSEQNTMIYLALEKGIFQEHGLNVTLRSDYPTGVEPLRDLEAGALDLAVSAEYPVVGRVLAGGDVSIVATVDRYQNDYLIGRQDRGVRELADLQGRRIGLPGGTILEFFLGRLLLLHGMIPGDVTLVDVPPARFSDAIADGEVDAIVCFQPHAARVLERLGETAAVWPAQSGQQVYGAISARNDWIDGHPDQLDRFLVSLDEAYRYAVEHPEETRSIVGAHMNVTDGYLAATWPEHAFGLSLEPSLVIAMNDEARWMVANNLTNATASHDLREHVHTAALARVRPGAVTIL